MCVASPRTSPARPAHGLGFIVFSGSFWSVFVVRDINFVMCANDSQLVHWNNEQKLNTINKKSRKNCNLPAITDGNVPPHAAGRFSIRAPVPRTTAPPVGSRTVCEPLFFFCSPTAYYYADCRHRSIGENFLIYALSKTPIPTSDGGLPFLRVTSPMVCSRNRAICEGLLCRTHNSVKTGQNAKVEPRPNPA